MWPREWRTRKWISLMMLATRQNIKGYNNYGGGQKANNYPDLVDILESWISKQP